jgi:hypothetical protein
MDGMIGIPIPLLRPIGENKRPWGNIEAYFFIYLQGVLCMLQMISEYGSITGMTDVKAVLLTDDEIRRIEIGSKCLLAGWCLYVTMIFCMKGCMLFVYQRLTYVAQSSFILCGLRLVCSQVCQTGSNSSSSASSRLHPC